MKEPVARAIFRIRSLRGRRRHEVNHVQAGGVGRGPQRPGLLGRQIGDDDSVRSRLDRRPAEGVEAEGEDGIVVGQENQWHLDLGPDLADELEHARNAHRRGERPLRRALDHGAVGQRIGERDAQLDDVRPALGRLDDQTARRLNRGVARREIGNERALSTTAQRRECIREPLLPAVQGGDLLPPAAPRLHRPFPRPPGSAWPFAPPRAWSTVWTSLSPRPESPTTIVSLDFMRAAARTA